MALPQIPRLLEDSYRIDLGLLRKANGKSVGIYLGPAVKRAIYNVALLPIEEIEAVLKRDGTVEGALRVVRTIKDQIETELLRLGIPNIDE